MSPMPWPAVMHQLQKCIIFVKYFLVLSTYYLIQHCPRLVDPVAIKNVPAIKILHLLDDLYKLSQLRLAITSFKVVQLLEDLYKLT